jgi:deoxyribodipyrimidine photo-lyase
MPISTKTEQPITLFWFRRDLRLHDNSGLLHALNSGLPVLPVFVFDTDILNDLADKTDARLTFLHREVEAMKQQLQSFGSDLVVRYGQPEQVIAALVKQLNIAKVYTNHDFEPYAKQRDARIQALLAEQNISFLTFKDHVVFQYDEILKDNGQPYVVFTPYSKKWKEKLRTSDALSVYASDQKTDAYLKKEAIQGFDFSMPTLAALGFEVSQIPIPERVVNQSLIANYTKNRDFPGLPNGTSRLGIHFRFGTISIREKARNALKINETYLNELIWRDFYAQILAHFPHVVDGPFRPEYSQIAWRDAPTEFALWCQGKTGYPLVDAGMRELNHTGFMHNRVRMVVASFLTKHLLINWQEGEAYFAEKLLDFDLASNNGGWQWAAGCGTDAAPYFRIFNPEEQMKRFDAQLVYVKKWVPEYGSPAYVKPIVEHRFARERCLKVYKEGLAR